MALKDLVASAAALREGDIEEIVTNFIRYDKDARSVVLTGPGNQLANKRKVLAVLVAEAGWIYVDENMSGRGLKPKEIEEITGIPGGTLRPLIRALAEERLVKSDKGAYNISPTKLLEIKKIVLGS